MQLILVRHGQTICNVQNIWHGWDDCELTEVGQAQAEAVGARLAALPIDVVYSSDSRRALQTAQAIARSHGLEPVPEPGLRERYSGEFEGRLVSDVLAARPTIWEERKADYWGWKPPGGETFREVLERVQRVLERIKVDHPKGTVVLVTHMCPVRLLISHLAGIPIEKTYESEFPSTGVSVFELDGERVHAELLNDATHVA